MDTDLYESLVLSDNDIRLVHLNPSQDERSHIVCSLTKVSLNDSPVYDALSYCWGDPTDRMSIKVNGRDFKVTSNLFSALKTLRGRDDALVVWIDSICIDQRNTRERNMQVQKMGIIYRQAQCVRMWVGEETANSNLIVPLIRLWTSERLRFSTDSSGLPTPTSAQIMEGPLCDPHSLSAVGDLLYRPYWTRVWVFQEISLASNRIVHCGSEHFRWEDFRTMGIGFMIAYDARRGRHSKEAEYLAGALLGINHIAKSDVTRGFLEILKNTRHLSCTDPRDKIYGLLELCDFTSTPLLRLTPDYFKSVRDVYTDVATRVIKTTGNLSILLTAGIEESKEADVGLPSWVPDFSKSCWECRYEHEGFNASANRVAKVNFLSSPRGVDDILEADGVIIDNIIAKFNWAPFGEYQADATKLLLRLSELHALFRTLIFDTPNRYYGKMEIADRDDCKELCLCAIGFAHDLEERGIGGGDKFLDSFNWLDWPSKSQHQLSNMAEKTRKACHVRYLNQSRLIRESRVGRCFLTAGRYFGLGPPLLKTRDSLCILLGCATPLIVRREDDHFRLVGPCYVYGMMMGEVMDQMDRLGTGLKVETLRFV